MDGWVGGWVGGRPHTRTVFVQDRGEDRDDVLFHLGQHFFVVFGGLGGWVGWMEENEAVRMSYCELGVGWVGGGGRCLVPYGRALPCGLWWPGGEVGGWVGEWVGDRKEEEEQAVRTSYCELGEGGLDRGGGGGSNELL